MDISPESETVPEDRLVVRFVDVGQGDCTLITCGGSTMLIDCGEASEAASVSAELKKLGIEKIDHLIGTHIHSDHMGGMYKIAESFEIGEVLIPHVSDNDMTAQRYFMSLLDVIDEKNIKLKEAELYQQISLGDAVCRVIAPQGEDYGNMNNYSICIYLTHGKSSFLFTGDAEKKSEKEMIDAGVLRHASVLKVGHHGSSTSSAPEFLDIAEPDYAVISCGAGNSYGHPEDITLEKLEKYTDKIYRTDLNGSVIFESDGEELTVRTERSKL